MRTIEITSKNLEEDIFDTPREYPGVNLGWVANITLAASSRPAARQSRLRARGRSGMRARGGLLVSPLRRPRFVSIVLARYAEIYKQQPYITRRYSTTKGRGKLTLGLSHHVTNLSISFLYSLSSSFKIRPCKVVSSANFKRDDDDDDDDEDEDDDDNYDVDYEGNDDGDNNDDGYCDFNDNDDDGDDDDDGDYDDYDDDDDDDVDDYDDNQTHLHVGQTMLAFC
ncbi:hypothetical protein ElyMa_001182500 [Elysia marginata]|uniref:Uncharacterized protein n=1 Tax=Elysia marginata TaxID=1093978 RepID=A0AAV4I496_9GAST|nr:hypothetical protein ElyMa_001182500 [Elysia marginata]